MLCKQYVHITFPVAPVIHPSPVTDMIPTFRTAGRLGVLALVLALVAACSGKPKDGTATAGDSAASGKVPAQGAPSANQPKLR